MRANPKPKRPKFGLHFIMTFFIFLVMAVSIAITALAVGILTRIGVIDLFSAERNPLIVVFSLLVFSVLLSTIMAAMGSNRMLKPIRKVIDATRAVAEGDFNVRLDVGHVPELEELNSSFNKMVEELGSVETLRSDFVSSFSHEFKTPIVSIRGFAKLLKDKDLPEDEREEYADIIISESERLAGLSTNILNLSKLENIGILTDKEQFHLDEQIRRAAALLEPRWRDKNLNVTLQMEPVKIYSDETLLQQVWMNLLDNAIKFTDAGGRISITLKQNADHAIFKIEDSGRGMDEAALSHVFDKFYQNDKSRSGAGNGLGLSLVQQAVTLCDGSIRVDSVQGKGSKFTVTLPLGNR